MTKCGTSKELQILSRYTLCENAKKEGKKGNDQRKNIEKKGYKKD